MSSQASLGTQRSSLWIRVETKIPFSLLLKFKFPAILYILMRFHKVWFLQNGKKQHLNLCEHSCQNHQSFFCFCKHFRNFFFSKVSIVLGFFAYLLQFYTYFCKNFREDKYFCESLPQSHVIKKCSQK